MSEDHFKYFIGFKEAHAMPMNRQQYNDLRGWELPSDEDGGDDGYLIEDVRSKPNHPDYEGHLSWSPLEVFESTFRSTAGMTFGLAIEAMKKGHKVARAGWNGKGMWVIYNAGSQGKTFAMADGSVYKKRGVDECEILPHFDMYTVNASGRRAMLVGWAASQTDMLAEDWNIVE